MIKVANFKENCKPLKANSGFTTAISLQIIKVQIKYLVVLLFTIINYRMILV